MMILIWALGFAILFSVGGYFFGGLARYFAFKFRRAPEQSAGQSFAVGAIRGAIFGGIVGMLLGGFVGAVESPGDVGIARAISFVFVLGVVAVVAIVLGSIGFLIEWFSGSRKRTKPPDLDDNIEI